jgi:hypothetical protein
MRKLIIATLASLAFVASVDTSAASKSASSKTTNAAVEASAPVETAAKSCVDRIASAVLA